MWNVNKYRSWQGPKWRDWSAFPWRDVPSGGVRRHGRRNGRRRLDGPKVFLFALAALGIGGLMLMGLPALEAIGPALTGTVLRLPLLEIVVFLVAFLVFALALFGIAKRMPRGSGPCRWRRLGARRPPFTSWECRACGAEAFSSDGRPPKECKKTLEAAARSL